MLVQLTQTLLLDLEEISGVWITDEKFPVPGIIVINTKAGGHYNIMPEDPNYFKALKYLKNGQACEWIACLDESFESVWFNAFSRHYSCKLEAAIDYLSAHNK